jgi:hypothetical protein
VISPNNPEILFALTEADGLYRCTLGGTCWEKVQLNFLNLTQGVFESGHPFSKLPFLVDEMAAPSVETTTPALFEMQFAPSEPQIAFLGTSGSGVYQSKDGGSTWSPSGLDTGKIISLAVDPSDALQVFAASDTQVFSSIDGGVSWTDTELSGVNIYALAADINGNLYAGTSHGIYKLSNIGWSSIGLVGFSVTALAVNHDFSIYAGTNDGLKISYSDGNFWKNGPLDLKGLTIRSITFDPNDPSWLYISTKTQGVLQLQD